MILEVVFEFGLVVAVGALELRLFAALVFQMSVEVSLPFVPPGALRAGE